jgi:hypothetical protein
MLHWPPAGVLCVRRQRNRQVSSRHLQTQVVKARHKTSDRIVALKRVWQNSGNGFSGSVHEADGTAAALPAALLREAEALRTVRHPNVVQLHRTFPLVSTAPAFTRIYRLCCTPWQRARECQWEHVLHANVYIGCRN